MTFVERTEPQKIAKLQHLASWYGICVLKTSNEFVYFSQCPVDTLEFNATFYNRPVLNIFELTWKRFPFAIQTVHNMNTIKQQLTYNVHHFHPSSVYRVYPQATSSTFFHIFPCQRHRHDNTYSHWHSIHETTAMLAFCLHTHIISMHPWAERSVTFTVMVSTRSNDETTLEWKNIQLWPLKIRSAASE